MLYTHVHIGSEGHAPKSFKLSVVVGLPGDDIVFTETMKEPEDLIKSTYLKLKRVLSKQMSRRSSST